MKAAFLRFLLAAAVVLPGAHAQKGKFGAPPAVLLAREGQYWERTPLPIPSSIVLEATGVLPLPGKRLMVATRHGEMWMIDGAYDSPPHPTYHLYARGMHEVLGLCVAPPGGYYVVQRPEVTRVFDTRGDGHADLFETICRLPVSGSHHEFAFGPVIGPEGNLRISLNVAFRWPTQSPVPWRGWMMDVTPDGQMMPVAAGLRSPSGILRTSKGIWIYSENQGEWMGTDFIFQVDPGDFMGHRASLAWSKLPGSPVKLRQSDVLDFNEPLVDVAKKLPGLKLPAIVLPYTVQGISATGLTEDLSQGKFGPFAGQFFVGDEGQSLVTRFSLEQVKGVWQGASYAFREGFDCGIIRVVQGEDGDLFIGESNRGWGSYGTKPYGLERLRWTGRTPFEYQEVTAEPDGFRLAFTQPVDPAVAADAANYKVRSFTYLYHEAYGSPVVYLHDCPIRKVQVAADGRSVRLVVGLLREGYVHEITAGGVTTAGTGELLVHPTAFYTLNRIPDGERISPEDTPAERAALVESAAPEAKRKAAGPPADWTPAATDRTVALSAVPGMKFDPALIEVPAGSHVTLVIRNQDDMLHNFVLCTPGNGPTVGQAAMTMGLEGMAQNYVPYVPDVLTHSPLVQPRASETVYFTAPEKPGDYDFICSFPGHYLTMKGTFRVSQ